MALDQLLPVAGVSVSVYKDCCFTVLAVRAYGDEVLEGEKRSGRLIASRGTVMTVVAVASRQADVNEPLEFLRRPD